MSAGKPLREFVDDLPVFTDDAADRLRHTLAAFADPDPMEWAIQATYNAVGPGVTTGLTWGDLRELLRRLDGC